MKILKSFAFILVLVSLGYLFKEGFKKTENKVNGQISQSKVFDQEGPQSLMSNEAYSKINNEELNDDVYKNFLRSASFEEAILHLIKKSEEHVRGQPQREDYIKKLDVMTQYIDYDLSILRRGFDFFVSYYTLNAFDQRESKMSQIEYILKETYEKELQKSHYCLDFFKEVGRKNVNYPNLSSAVMTCAGDSKKRDVVFDYVNFLKSTKGEDFAIQEYTKLRLMHIELPEYGSF